MWGMNVNHSFMLVRACYPTYVAHLNELLSQPQRPTVVVGGSPGTGLSYFGVYLLATWLQEGKVVLFDGGDHTQTLLVPPTACEQDVKDVNLTLASLRYKPI